MESSSAKSRSDKIPRLILSPHPSSQSTINCYEFIWVGQNLGEANKLKLSAILRITSPSQILMNSKHPNFWAFDNMEFRFFNSQEIRPLLLCSDKAQGGESRQVPCFLLT